MMILSEILFFLRLIPLAFWGWFRSVVFLFVNFVSFYARKTILEQISILFLIAQIIMATQPWVSYRVQFLSQPELIDVSIKINLWVLGWCGLVFLMHFFWDHNLHKFFFLFGQLALVALLVIGYFLPNPLLVDFLVREDFSFNVNYYIFSGLVAITSLLSILRLISSPKKEQPVEELESETLLDWQQSAK